MHIDTFVQNYFSATRTPIVTEYMYVLTSLFDVSFYSVVLVLFMVLFIQQVRNIKYSILFVSSLISGSVIVYLIKVFSNVARPTDAVMNAFGQSFPSYHSTISTIFFIMLMYIFDNYFSPVLRIIFNTFCILSIIVISISRLYLGVHWLSDVVFGIILGGVISYLCIVVFRKYTRSL